MSGVPRTASAADRLAYVAFAAGVALLRALPEPISRALIAALLPAARMMLSRRRRMALRNLLMSIPGVDPRTAAQMARAAERSAAWTFAEALRLLHLPALLQRRVIVPREVVRTLDALRAGGRPVVIVTAHLGNWELFAQWLVLRGYPVAAIVREMSNPLIDRTVNAIRERLGGTVFREHEVGHIGAWLRRGGIVYLLMDQHIAAGSVRVDFLGRAAFTTPFVTMLHKRFGARVLPVVCVRRGNRLVVETAGEFVPTYTGELRRDWERNTERLNAILGEFIRRYPAQWLWLHNRWKDK